MGIDTVWVVVSIPTPKYEQQLSKLQEYKDFYYYPGSLGSGDDDIRNGQSLEAILTDALLELKISNAVWVPTKSGNFQHVYFPVELVNNDYTFYYLRKNGIGSQGNSSLGYIPFSMYLYNDKVDDPMEYDRSYVAKLKDSFLRSVTARLTVAQVVDGVVNGCTPNFDYWVYLFTSCVIACMGIMNTSPIDVAASMMIEPIMGAVICCAFGCAIHNWTVVWHGITSLIYADIFCIIFGFGFGGIFLLWRVAWNPPPDGAWPTPEMQSRGEYKTLIYGAVIASAGGACLAVVLLQNNIMAMTGVAVATTFMPPLVNAGICWALAAHIQGAGIGQPWQTYTFEDKTYVLREAYIPKGGYVPDWSYDIRVECLILGAISCAYHLINVIFLFSFGYIVLKMKFIIPLKYIPTIERKFFNEDIRAYKEHMDRYPNDQNMGRQILEEWADMVGVDKKTLMSDTPEARATQLQTMYDIMKDVEENQNYQRVTRNAVGNRHQRNLRNILTIPNAVDDDVDIVVHNNNDPTNRKNMQTLNVSAIDNPAFVNDSNGNVQNIRRSLRYSRGSIVSIWPPSNDPSIVNMPQNNINSSQVPSYIRNRSRSTLSINLDSQKNDF